MPSMLSLCIAFHAATANAADKPTPAHDAAAFNKLLETGQAATALQGIEAALSDHPRDAQLRFLKGVALMQQQRASEAIEVFLRLTEEFPELAEPYNNLAVLYASKSELGKARAALEMAIRAAPDFAVAHENLGDLYLDIAASSYARAAKLEPGSQSVQRKLKLTLDFSQNVHAIKRAP
jgi:Flp pilus assembly protein TadD